MEYNLELAGKLPAQVLFGTSSWTYPGWKGSIYNNNYKSEKSFKTDSLQEYCQFPWFRTVGIDSSFYGPLKEKVLANYSAQVPESFKWVSKVWERITIPIFPKHARYGAAAGKSNPDFLSSELFNKEVLGPYRDNPTFKKHCGPMVFQFQNITGEMNSQPDLFFDKLDGFLSKLDPEFSYATEVRNKNFLVADYFSILNRNSATHCFNHWNYMPPLIDQMKAAAMAGGVTAPFYVARILTPLGLSYQNAVGKFQPYDRIKQKNQSMRNDVVRLAKRAIEKKSKAYIIVNNRSEGHSPGTISEIGSGLVAEHA